MISSANLINKSLKTGKQFLRQLTIEHNKQFEDSSNVVLKVPRLATRRVSYIESTVGIKYNFAEFNSSRRGER